MGQRRQFTFTTVLRLTARATIFAAIVLIAVNSTGCAALCMGGGSATAAPTGPTADATVAHRPIPFPDSPGDEPAAPPQVVNVFGEVNGSPARPTALTSDAAFEQHTFTDEGYDSDVAVDPTGKWLCFSSTRNSEHPSIYVQAVGGNAVTQLTDGSADDVYPDYSPDGKQIAFSSTRAGGWQLFVMDADGRNIVQLTSGPMQAVHPSFSPDGTRLVYCCLGARSGQWELWTLDLKSTQKKMIGYGLFPVWSPSRSQDRIAFQKARQRGSRWFSLWTLDLIDGEARRSTEIAVSANAAILSPAWSPDGRKLAFATILQPGKGGQATVHGQTDIWTIDADGGNRQRLTDGRGNNLMPFWASDNRVFFVSDRGGAESIWSVRTDTHPAPTLANDSPAAEPKKTAAVDQSEETH